jgi:hypothetical protein
MKSLEIEQKMKKTAEKWQSLLKNKNISEERMKLIKKYQARYEELSKAYWFQRDCEDIANQQW